jgi:hypothetical protein
VIPFVDGTDLVFQVNCAEDGGKLLSPVPFALCVILEVGQCSLLDQRLQPPFCYQSFI